MDKPPLLWYYNGEIKLVLLRSDYIRASIFLYCLNNIPDSDAMLLHIRLLGGLDFVILKDQIVFVGISYG